MIFRRRPKKGDATDTGGAGAAAGVDGSAVDAGTEDAAGPQGRERGPWDRAETTRDEDDASYVDLGGLVVKGAEGVELRLQVDQPSQTVTSVLLAGSDSGLELRAFAAPRHEGLWDEVRGDIAAEAVKRGGTAEEQEGEHGTELRVVMPVQTPDGRRASQLTRVVGVDGPRWLLRGTFLGRSAQQPDSENPLESAFRDVIVVRGDSAMAPRVMLPLRMPAQTHVVGDADG